ncbi:uncharacterized protein LOC112136064 [Pongo abelii]|uniref:uncharacterized protein LOC112136064 n=1 Tax=Pongo abelii TaxID=9601 RepID=UPI0023E8B338|nr:uncharacterized protein LOC112136064 [Pongo abelii]
MDTKKTAFEDTQGKILASLPQPPPRPAGSLGTPSSSSGLWDAARSPLTLAGSRAPKPLRCQSLASPTHLPPPPTCAGRLAARPQDGAACSAAKPPRPQSPPAPSAAQCYTPTNSQFRRPHFRLAGWAEGRGRRAEGEEPGERGRCKDRGALRSAQDAVEGLNRTEMPTPQQDGILPADGLWTQTAALPWVSSLQAYPPDFGFAKLLQLYAKWNEQQLTLVASSKGTLLPGRYFCTQLQNAPLPHQGQGASEGAGEVLMCQLKVSRRNLSYSQNWNFWLLLDQLACRQEANHF